MYAVLIWSGMAVLAVLAEFYTNEGVAAMLIPGSAGAALVAYFELPLWLQALTFLGASVLFFGIRALVLGRKQGQRLEIEQALGARCVVQEQVDNRAGAGLVSYGGNNWAAKSLLDEDVLEIGETVTVVAVEGVKLICKR